MKLAVKGVKGVLGVGIGLVSSTIFVTTMDDMVYANFRKHVVMPMQLARLNGDNTSVLQATVTGTARFLKDMQPLGPGLTSDNAKALLLKDTDYSTPSDHYFAYL